MAKFILSAFADEYSPVFDEQIKGLIENDVHYMEIRGVDGKNISDLTPDEAKVVREKLDANGIGVSSVGSPLGKISVNDAFEPHLEKQKRTMELAHILGTDRIRMFSYYIPEGKTPNSCRNEVFDRMGQMLDAAKAENIILCHENERGIYGDIAERCLDIQRYFNGEIKCVFDHANFICCDSEPYRKAYEMLKDYIFYMHIKDATKEKHMAPSGAGIGRIPETIDRLREYDKTFFLTVEPHLQVFNGVDKLQDQGGKDGVVFNQYSSHAEAFAVAVNAIRNIVNGK